MLPLLPGTRQHWLFPGVAIPRGGYSPGMLPLLTGTRQHLLFPENVTAFA